MKALFIEFINEEIRCYKNQFNSIHELIEYIHCYEGFEWLLKDQVSKTFLINIKDIVAKIVSDYEITLDIAS